MIRQVGYGFTSLAMTISICLFSSCAIFRPISGPRKPPLQLQPDRILQKATSEAPDFTAARMTVDSLMNYAVGDSVFPGAVLLVAQNGVILHQRAYGNFGYGKYARSLDLAALFDLASVTKVIATTSAAMILVGDGRLKLDEPVGDFIAEFRQGKKARVTIRHLLTHSSGLPPYVRYFLENLNPPEIVDRIFAESLIYEPGTAYKYSDLGMIILGKIIEQITGTTLDRFCYQEIFRPLQMQHTMFNPPRRYWPQIPPTENDPWRGRLVHGEVHDENAFALGGVAGHAGLFSTCSDLAIFCQMILNGGTYNGEKIFDFGILRQFITRQNLTKKSTRALGWDTRSKKGSSSGDYLSRFAFGHTGFTGTSLWLDPENELFIILLSNRVHPTRDNRKIIQFRPLLHNTVMKTLININQMH